MTIRFLLILCICVTSFNAMSQHFSDDGRFSVADIVACAPYGNPIVINAPECDGTTTACSIDFDYEDGIPNTLALVDGDAFNYSYTEPGTYVIRVQFGTTGGFDQITLTILPNEAPDFNIYTCSGNRVQLDITDTNYAQYSIDYQSDGTVDATSPSGMVSPYHTYADAALKNVTVRPGYANCDATTKQVTPVPGPFSPSPPVITELVVNANNIELDINTAPNFLYQLDVSPNGTSSWNNMQNVTDESELTISSLTPENNYYCFRLGTIDACDGTPPIYTGSNTICSSRASIDVADDEITIDWNTSNAGVNSFTITRDPGSATSVSNAQPYTFVDSDIVCGTTYSYRVINEYGSGIRSISKVLTGTAISNRVPSPIDNITTVVDGNSVDLTWLQDPGFTADEYRIFRIANNKASLEGTTATTSFTAENWDIESEICYRIDYDDVCGNKSPSGSNVCPIVLNASVQKNNAVSLSWTAYNGWAGGVNHYVVEKYNASGQLIQSVDVGSATAYVDSNTADDEQVASYRILAVASNQSELPDPSVSNLEQTIRNPNLSHPTAFIPQADIPANRTFRVFGSFINTYQLKIFNRWGELIFESTDPERGWDGTYRGQQMPEGTYVFQTRVTDYAGRSFDYAGTFVLLKKG